jgi:hypothetical protein
MNSCSFLIVKSEALQARITGNRNRLPHAATVAPYAYRALKSGGGLVSAFSVSGPVSVDLGATAHASSPGSPTKKGLTTPFSSDTAPVVPSTSSGRALTRSRPADATAHKLSVGPHRHLNRDLEKKPIRSPFPGSIKPSIRGRLVHA